VATVAYTAPLTPLTIATGYSLSDQVSYQARTTPPAGRTAGVTCYVGGTTYNTTADAAGNFRIPNIRQTDFTNCTFFSRISRPDPSTAGQLPDLYLAAGSDLEMRERGSYSFMPRELIGGNLDRGNQCGSNQCINSADLAIVTQNWQTNANGDVNGDGKTDRADLAIVASNNGRQELDFNQPILFSVARTWATYRDSKIVRGNQDSGAVVPQVPGVANTVDLWPQLSPDGSTIAFVRKTNGVGTAPGRYELFKMAANGTGTPTLILSKAQAGNLDAFAPSWSQDNTVLAFICSEGYGSNQPYSGYGSNSGSLCLVDITGRNFRRVSAPNTARIFPPAWYGYGYDIFYSGTPQNVDCPNTICGYNGSFSWRLDDDIPGNTDTNPQIADMPTVVNHRIFYRYTDSSGNSTLRYIDNLNWDSCNPGPCDPVKPYTPHPAACPGQPGHDASSPRPYYAHSDVVYDSDEGPGCTYVPLDVNYDHNPPYILDYYAVRPYGMEITMYAMNFHGPGFYTNHMQHDLTTVPGNPCDDNNTTTDTDECYFEWSPNTFNNSNFRVVDGMWGNFSAVTYPAPSASLYWAERDTLDWSP